MSSRHISFLIHISHHHSLEWVTRREALHCLRGKSFRTFRDMKGRLTTVAGSWWAVQSAGNRVRYPGVRQFVMKASDRAALHGVKPLIQDIVDKEEGEEVESQRAEEEREKKRKEIRGHC